jgi:hypothetical protein
VYAHFFAGFVVVAQWIAVRLLDDEGIEKRFRRNWRDFAIAISPLVLFVLTTGTGVLRWIPRPRLADLGQTFVFFSGNGGAWLLLIHVAAIVFALIAVRDWKKRSVGWKSWRYRYLLVWLLFPILFVFLVSQFKHLYLARYFIFCLPALILLVAAGLDRIRWRLALGLALIAIGMLSLRGVNAYYEKDFDIGREDWRSATRYVLEHAQAGDVVILHQPIGRMPYEYYVSRVGVPNQPAVIYPAHGDRLTFRDFYAGHAPDSFLQAAADRYPRVWFLFTYNDTPSGPDPTTQYVDEVFGKEYSSEQVEGFPGIVVRLYSRSTTRQGIHEN